MGNSPIFWAVSVTMALVAFSFLATPLMRVKRRPALVGIAVLFAAVSAGTYWYVGSPQAINIESATSVSAVRSQTAVSESRTSVSSVASMVEGLAKRLQDNPDDGKGWLLLAQSYKHLGRTTDAIDAFRIAKALGMSDDELEIISESSVSQQSAAQVFGNVRLAEGVQGIVLPTDTVFIFARAIDGPPMPVAVFQRPASELPIDFLLNDSQALSTDVTLSQFDQVVVTARISRSGIAADALKGLEARSDTIVVAENRHLNLTINNGQQ